MKDDLQRRNRILAFFLLFMCLTAIVHADDATVLTIPRKAIYEAKSNTDFHLRDKPESTKWVGSVRRHQRVEVLEYGETWSLLRCNGETGYAENRWLREFISLDPFHNSLPGYVPCTGLWTFRKKATVSGGEFSGLSVSKGAIVSVRETDGQFILPVWRSETVLDPSTGEYSPFSNWKTAQKGDLIAAFTTFYNDAFGAPKAKERQHNIELACSLMSGSILKTGESFSFNTTCGPYGMKTGYVVAKNISSSGYGVGGGVCQLSTTLYNAVLQVPIRITEWEVHSVSGVKYIPLAYDACVGTYSDLCFENTLPYTIRLEAMAQNGALTVMIYRGE